MASRNDSWTMAGSVRADRDRKVAQETLSMIPILDDAHHVYHCTMSTTSVGALSLELYKLIERGALNCFRMKSTLNLFLALLCIHIVHESVIQAELLQVQIVHRHGARSHLSKDGAKPGLENGAQLLPEGVEQLRTLGGIVRSRYLEPTSNTKIRSGLQNYSSPLDLLSISTNLDRTLASARAFLVGLYPLNHELIPTKTYGAKENDYRLRGYAICPDFDEHVELRKIGEPFRALFKEHSQFLERIARAVNEEPTVKSLFNIYDKYKLTSLGHPTPPGTKPLSASDWAKLKKITDLVECTPFNIRNKHSTASSGQPLFATLMSYSTEISKHFDNPSSTTHRIIEYSAHYPTLLSLFDVMLPESPDLTPPSNSIPEFGAALLWETHRADDGSFFIRTLWYSGDSKPPKQYSILPCAPKCTLNELSSLFRGRLSTAPQPFCSACKTNPNTSPICADGALPSHINDNIQVKDSPPFQICQSARISSGFIGGASGIGLVILGWIIVRCIRMYRMKQERRRLARMNSISNTAEIDPGWSGANKASASGSTGPSIQ